MIRYRRALPLLSLLALACACEPDAADEAADANPIAPIADRAPLPPARVEIESPDGNFVFILTNDDQWRSRKATASLFAVREGERELRWTRTLSHDLGPRFALVGAHGHVLLVDEWINVASRRALVLLGGDGEELARMSHAEIVERTGLSAREVLTLAHHGTWISSPPQLAPSGLSARVGVAGRVLIVNLADGRATIGD